MLDDSGWMSGYLCFIIFILVWRFRGRRGRRLREWGFGVRSGVFFMWFEVFGVVFVL